MLFPVFLCVDLRYAEFPLNKKPPHLELKESCGGRLKGTVDE
jgi:hypothetical protein